MELEDEDEDDEDEEEDEIEEEKELIDEVKHRAEVADIGKDGQGLLYIA